MSLEAIAQPTKRFFLEMLTRDLSLEDAILDLVDNAVDALTRKQNVDVSDKLLTLNGAKNKVNTSISIEINENEFRIKDNCGGIDFDSAKNEVFCFGKVIAGKGASLSVYGIGLKRAVFKIGRNISVKSHTEENGFEVNIDVDTWAKDENKWVFPLKEMPKAKSIEEAGTLIVIRDLRPEIKMRLKDGTFKTTLKNMIASGYPLFLDKYVNVSLDGTPISAKKIPIGHSDEVSPAFKKYKFDGVDVTLIVGLAERIQGQWNSERAGWYVVCNGRVVVSADRTILTGWGVQLPQFVGKYRGFMGIAFFFSKNPELLPWTTTKRGLHTDSNVYQLAKSQMQIHARPVLNFLNDMYANEASDEKIEEREIAEDVKATEINAIVKKPETEFKVVSKKLSNRSETVRVQFDAKKASIEKVKKCLKKPSWSASQVGKYALDYLMEQECP